VWGIEIVELELAGLLTAMLSVFGRALAGGFATFAVSSTGGLAGFG